jgi:non-ribosomal peptide synthetase component F
MDASFIFRLAFWSIFGIILAGGVADAWFAVTGRATITDFLRQNPSWYWTGAALMLAFLVVLGLHLYADDADLW